MKLNETELKVHSTGTQDSGGYIVSQSAHIMDLLSRSLYGDPKKAPVREICCNSSDSMIVSGNTHLTPVINLPSESSLEFKVRDFGTGLSVEQMGSVYRVYGISDKQDSNKLTGCMGLGSKSPFAYTNSFTTISYYNGTKYVWINTKDKDGKPTLNLFHEEPTEELNGLEVSFAVKSYDINDFVVKTIEVMKYFKNRFILIKDGIELKPNYEIPTKLKGNGWALGLDSPSYIVMGNIQYPLEQNKFPDATTQSVAWYQYTNPYALAIQSNIILECNIGEVDFDISREKLRYTDKTLNLLKAKIDIFYKEFEQTLKTNVETCKSNWQKRQMIHSLVKGSKLANLVEKVNLGDLKVERATKQKVRRYTTRNSRKVEYAQHISAIPTTKVYVQDVPGRIAEVKEYLSNHTDEQIILVGKAEMVEFMLEQGMIGEDILMVSNLPRAPKSTATYNRRLGKIFKFRSASRNKASEYWADLEEDEDLDGIYVNIDHYQVNNEHPRLLNETIQWLEKLGYKVPQIYGFKKNAEIDEEMQSLKEYVVEQLQDWLNLNKDDYQIYLDMNRLGNKDKWVNLSSSVKNINASDILDLLSKIVKKTEVGQSFSYLCSRYGFSSGLTASTNLKVLEENLLVKYKMLDIISSWEISDNKKAVVSYVNMVDSCCGTDL